MNEIVEVTAFEVDGVRFDTRAAAQDHAIYLERKMHLQEFLHDVSNMTTYEAEYAAETILKHWPSVRRIIEANS